MSEQTRQNLSDSLEDYLEAIFKLSGKDNVARSRDIAEILGVSKASVTGALKILKKKGLVNYEPYGYITLTRGGSECASRILRKHNILKSFFVNVLGIENEVAHEAACKAEHDFGPEIISRFLCFIEFVENQQSDGRRIADDFKQFASQRLGNEGSLQVNG